MTRPWSGDDRLTLRAVQSEDRSFLLDLYAATRAQEFSATAWDSQMWAAFVAQQFAAQDAAFRAGAPDAAYDLVLLDGEPVGRFYVGRRERAIHVIDITLTPELRGLGIGTVLLRALVAESDALGATVSLHVARHNPARRLYERLGLVEMGGDEVYLLMERPPAAVVP